MIAKVVLLISGGLVFLKGIEAIVVDAGWLFLFM